MRGEREQKCLDRVANSFNNGKLYGLSCEDMEFLEAAIRSAKPNPESSVFPDFICENGIIEHFSVSSSKTTSKGSELQKEYSHYRKKTNQEIAAFKAEDNTKEGLIVFDKRCWSFNQPVHSYDYLAASFTANWESHISSLQQFGKKQRCIFVIDYQEIALEMIEDVFEGVKERLRFDDLREQQRIHTYRISRDKELLKYVHQFADTVDIVIWAFFDGWEAIKLENIPEMLKLMPWDYKIAAKTVLDVESATKVGVRYSNE